MLTTMVHRCSSAFVSPELSRPNSSATEPFLPARREASCAGVMAVLRMFLVLVLGFAVVPTTFLTPRIASPRLLACLALSTISLSRVAYRYASSPIVVFGYTRRRSDKPKFLIDRAIEPILPSFSGSTSKTRNRRAGVSPNPSDPHPVDVV